MKKKFEDAKPPDDGRRWIRAAEATEMLQLSTRGFYRLAKRHELTFVNHGTYAPRWYLYSEIATLADRRQLRRRWCQKHHNFGHYPRTTEQMDLQTARELFIPTKEVAAMLGVGASRVTDLVHKGRLISYQARPGQKGSPAWFSRRAVVQLMEESKRQKALEMRASGHRSTKKLKGTGYTARDVRGVKIPNEWLTIAEVAARLDVSISAVHNLRKRGRLRAERIWRRNGWLHYWYIPAWEVERLENDEEYQKLHREGKALYEARRAAAAAKILVGNGTGEDLPDLHSRARTDYADERPGARPDWADERPNAEPNWAEGKTYFDVVG